MIDTSVQRVKVSQVIENQLPEFVQAENPLFVDFMKQYYISQEFQGGTIDIAENLDRYTKLQTFVGTALTEYTGLSTDTQNYSKTIYVDTTDGYPAKYGLLKIDDEIITYTGVGATSFTGCIRGFSGVDSMDQPNRPDLLSFKTSVGAAHTGGTKVYNLSNLFIREFFSKLKTTFASGFENRKLDSDLDQVKFIRQVKDFYKTKGTDEAYKILFRALYGEEVKVIKPSEFLLRPSDADYQLTQDFIVKSITGDPRALKSSTLVQDKDDNDENILGASGAISDVKDFMYGGEHYYQISVSKDSINGNFDIPGRTRLTNAVSVGGTVLTVDTTVGFPTSGSVSIANGDPSGIVTYTNKTLNQFTGLSTMRSAFKVGDDVRYGNVAYGYSVGNLSKKIEVLITGVLGEFDIPETTFYFDKKDKIRVGSFGVNKSIQDQHFNSWIHNVSVRHAPKSVTEISLGTFNIETTSSNDFLEEDFVEILDGDDKIYGVGRVTSVISNNVFVLSDIPGVDIAEIQYVRRRINRGNSIVHDNITKYTTDVQNTYEHAESSCVYVASPSIPSLGNEPITASDRSVEWSGTTDGTEVQVTTGADDHGFYSGEVVKFSIVSGHNNLTDGKNYYIKRVSSNNVQFANSLPDLVQNTFVDSTGTGTFKISVPDIANKKLEHQKLLKKIPINPDFDGSQYETTAATSTGILINGTEIYNYKSGDVIFYGGVKSIDVLEGGSGYDLITPPTVTIESTSGSGVTATANIKGQFERIDIVDPGFDYIDEPVVEISGGNGSNAVARSRLRLIDHFIDFDASSTGDRINIANDTIGFTTFHKFRDGEPVIYQTFNTGAIGIASAGITTDQIQTTPDQRLVDNEIYYIAKVDASTIKLANTREEALSKSNLLNLTGYADGTQRFQSLERKKVLGDIIIDNPGEGFENKRRLVKPAGINTYSDYIEYTGHGFKDGEIVQYSFDGTGIGGIDTEQQYYVLKVNDDRFRLASAGIGTTLSDANYLAKQFVGFTSVGTGDHIFNYPPISVNVKGTIGVNTTTAENYHAVVNPIVRGSITSINVEKPGTGYGSPTIFNFSIPPTIRVSSGSSSEYKAIVSDGKIQDIIITRSGGEYTSTPDLTILGDGIGAKVVSSIDSNGNVSKVTVKNGGVGYSTATVSVQENIPGTGAVFLSKIDSWNIDNVKRYEDIFDDDDGFLVRGDNDEGIKFTSMYAPRALRKVIKQKNSDNTLDYAQNDLSLVNNAEEVSGKHSPIIGWAYDGNPIYGPYGYDRKDGGIARLIRSSYSLKTSRENGPSVADYPLGFFIEDYEYLGNGDLDRNNGRFCVTPDYPRGTYAYFATINTTENETSGTFKNYRSPVFPYLIGEKFAAKPNDWNFTETNNQSKDINTSAFRRNTYPYKLDSPGARYSGIYDSRKIATQETEVNYSSPGGINQYEIVSSGDNYQVNEKLNISDLDNGDGFSARISKVVGKDIVSIASTVVKIDNVVFTYDNQTGGVVGLSSQPHGLTVGDRITVSGLSTDSLRQIDGRHTVGFNTSLFTLDSAGIGTTGATGIVTSIKVSGDLSPKNILPNDIIGIGLTERMLVLNVDPVNSEFRVQREYNGTVGASHSGSVTVTSLNRAINFNLGISTDIITNVNVPYYFNPIETLSLGSTAGVGVGSTLSYSYRVIGATTANKFVLSQQAYLPDHSFVDGQKLIYENGGGTSIQVYNGISTFTLANNTPVFAIRDSKDLLGISTNPLGIGSDGSVAGIGSTAYRLFFTGNGSGQIHSFKPQKTEITGFVEKVVGTVVCKEDHNLLQNDTVSISLTPGISTTHYVEYDDGSKRTIIDAKTFGASSVNTSENTITINNHGYKTGDKILYRSSGTVIAPLINHEIYFIVRIDDNKFKLSKTYHSSTLLVPEIIGLTSTGSGHKIGLINPSLSLTRGYKVGFAVSDTSLSQTISGNKRHIFNFDLFNDKNFTNPYYTNQKDTGFQVVGVGTVGVTSTASVDLQLTDNSPSELFYRLTPVNLGIDADAKRDPVVDTDVINYSSLKINDSTYNGTYTITGIGSTTFTFNIPYLPERDSYKDNEAVILKYSTSSTRASGPIDKLNIVSKGRGYKTVPVVTSIGSTQGTGGLIRLNSTDVGVLRRYTTKNIGFDYSADKTIQPSVQLPQILRLDRLSTIDNIGITSAGKNYIEAPNLVVIDRVTNEVNEDVVTELELQGTSISKVNLLRNTNNLYDTNPKIVTTNNSNGVKVIGLSYTSGTNLVTLTLDGTYTTSTYPFTIGKEIYVENIGIGSTGSGYNSSNYNYKPFTVTGVNTNPGGGNATVSYNLDSSVTSPGIFSGPSSSGTVIRYEDMPIFNVTVKPNKFSDGEIISTGDKSGIVVSWNEDNKYIKVLSNDTFDKGEKINGQSSKSVAVIEQTNKFDSVFNITSNAQVISGWQRETGFLNDELQRLQDNQYYNTFAYSLGSVIDYDTWRDPVNSLGHVVGFKNFADVNVVSIAGTDAKNRSNANVTVGDAVAVTVTDLISEKESIHNTYDFDLVRENSKRIDDKTIASDEIFFDNKIITDYIEARSNRALSIDSVSSEFNDLPRATAYSNIGDFNTDEVRSAKYYVLLFDRRYPGEKEIIQVNVLHDDNLGYIMPFGRVETEIDLGTFDFDVTGKVGTLRFLPSKYKVNNYALRLFAIQEFNETDSTGIGSTTFGTGYHIESKAVGVGTNGDTPFQVVGLGTAGGTTTTKLLVLTNETSGNQRSQLNELVVMQHGSEVYMIDYAQMINENISETNSPSVGLGTFGADVRSGIATVYFTPVTGVGVTMRVHQTSIDSNASGIGSDLYSLTQVLTTTTDIAATSSPQPTRISGFGSNSYQAADCLIEITDTTNDRRAVTQVTMIHDGTTPYFSEWGYFDTFNGTGIGTIGVGYSSTSGGDLELRLTPPASTAVKTKVLQYNMTETGGSAAGIVTFTNSRIEATDSLYTGTENDVKFSFDLKHAGSPVFHKVFDSSDPAVVDVTNDTFIVDNHFFTTGEKITYTPTGAGTTMSIGIASTTVVGFGTTDKLPSTSYVVKIAENKFKLCGTATEALKAAPTVFNLSAVGVGTTHAFTSGDLNSKMIVTLDNNIQSPVIQSPINTKLSFDAPTTTDFITLVGISSFYSGDVIKVGDEFMKVDTVGIGSTNQILVKRGQLNSDIVAHSANDTVTKYLGNYQIVKDSINFTDAPKGAKGPAGLTTTSTFTGRAFIRSGTSLGDIDTYANNHVFDTVEDQFTGIATNFILKSGGQNITGFATNSAVLLLNEIFQNPANDYNVVETAGITSVSFTGAGVSVSYDVNVSSIPRGGVIVSVAETSNFGYQPLVAAGGTAIVSAAGTVESVSIGNSGSGYRVGLQTNILVTTLTSSGIVTIGTANVDAGIVTSVTITNGGGSGFSSASPPKLDIEPPLNYENIKLVGSSTGIGASISVRVGAATSVIDWTITNYGYNYKVDDVLYLEENGQAGIPTDASAGVAFTSFRLTVDKVFNDSFTGWTFGELEKLNTFEDLFDGVRTSFPLKKTIGAVATPITLRAGKGSPIKVEDNTLIFLNDVLQIPFESYSFKGGSQVTFSEAPKKGDKVRIYFFRGSDSDVIDVDILETVKPGDKLTINTYPETGLSYEFQQESRTITGISTADAVTTNTYIDIGITTNRTLLRPATWKKQTQDVIIGNIGIGKDRSELEAGIRPTAYIINNVAAGSTEVFTDTAYPLFNQVDDIVEGKQSVVILDKTTKTGAAATAIVSAAGTISSVVISDGGSGYTSAPMVSIGVTAGIGTVHAGIGTTESTNAYAYATVSGLGTISAVTIEAPGAGYTNTSPPKVLVAPEAQTDDKLSSVKYDGDFGIITGIGTTSVVGIATTGLTFDLHIPKGSVLRDTSVVSSASTVSGIQTGYYFIAYNTNVGGGLTSYSDATGTTSVGIGTSFIDNIYRVQSVETVLASAHGIGHTALRRVTVSVSSTEGVGIGSSSYFGEYSWGRLYDFVKSDTKSFNAINDDGVTGIITGPVIVRTRDLKESY